MIFLYKAQKEYKRMKKGQSDRLSEQQIEGQGPISIFHEDAQVHDK